MPSRRSRKKRRTEVSSSDSSDSSDSEVEKAEKLQQVEQPQDAHEEVEPSIDHLTLPASDTQTTREQIQAVEDSFEGLRRLRLDGGHDKLAAEDARVNSARDQLLSQYLGKMVGVYGNDLDELRAKADFRGEMSLKLAAQLLRESGNVFDDDVLRAVVRD